ncbi:MAG: hemolysin III family protein [Ruminococcaceae bacterium]|nr:hemolysin III family protein [Oscillospiraceae bacterium]
MKRTKLIDRKLPGYTKGEEIFNMVTHIVGGGFGVIALITCVIYAILKSDVYGIVGSIIYGLSMILLYTMSSIYHGLTNQTAKKVFQIIDHCTIFLLIAGTYTPIVLCSIRRVNPALGWGIFGFVWGVSILGIVLNAIDLKKYATFSMICYLLLGWCVVFGGKAAIEAIPYRGFIYTLAGGIAYTVGAVFYALGKKKNWRYIHSVFHIFVVLGSILQYIAIIFYIL